MINCYGTKITKMCATLYNYCANICSNYYEYDDDASKSCFCNCSNNLDRYNQLCVTYNEFEFSKMATALTICFITFVFMLIICRVCVARKLQLHILENNQHQTTTIRRLSDLPHYEELEATVIVQNNQTIPSQPPPQYNEESFPTINEQPPSYDIQQQELGKTV